MSRGSTMPQAVPHHDQSTRQLGFASVSEQGPSCPPSPLRCQLRVQQIPSVLAVARRRALSAPSVKFEDAEWISIFQLIHRLLPRFYPDKTSIEILYRDLALPGTR
jgi:hypothetical protein